jgi:cardiolipin synthase
MFIAISVGVTFFVLAIIALLVVGFLLFLVLFEPGLAYEVRPPGVPLDSPQFLCLIDMLTDSEAHGRSRVEVLNNGDLFYEEELKAIAAARKSINLEAYIFAKGDVTRRFVSALAERARAGVKVNLVLDTVGSWTTWWSRKTYFKELTGAGGRVAWYQPPRWDTFRRLNNRTHRELLIVDGVVGFIGGAGISDVWFKDTPTGPQWRDTMFRVHGDMVSGLQSAFLDNWLEAADEVLTGDEYFPFCRDGPGNDDAGGTKGMVVISAPQAGRGNRSRILFQTLLACATRELLITTPYFLPDRSARREMIKAVKERGVKLRVIVPGDHADHLLTRRSSRRRYGPLLQAGVEIYEYQPAMIHVKSLVVDGTWCVVGTTNFDNRSFGLNDEVNLATCDEQLAARMREDFERDLAQSRRVEYEKWKSRPMTERVVEGAGWVLERHT